MTRRLGGIRPSGRSAFVRSDDAHGQEPPQDVLAAVAARYTPVSVDRQVDTASGLKKFLGDLGSGRRCRRRERRPAASWPGLR